MGDDYTFIKPLAAYQLSKDQSTVIFQCCIEARTSPYGEANFNILSNVTTPDFKIKAEYVVGSHRSTVHGDISPLDFVKKHFTADLQNSFDIGMVLKCAAHSPEHRCGYVLNCLPLKFDLDSNHILPIGLKSEEFEIRNGSMVYRFKTSFVDGLTTILFNSPMKGFVIGKQETLEMNSEKFIRYPLDREFLLNKVKTLLLFS